MDAFPLIPLFAAVTNFVVAILVVLLGLRRRRFWVLFAFSLGAAGWNAGAFGLFVAESETVAVVWAQLTWACLSLLPAFFLHLTSLTIGGDRKTFVRVIYAAGAFCLAAVFLPGGVHEVERAGNAWYAVIGPGQSFYLMIFIPVCFGWAGWTLWGRFKDPDAQLAVRCKTLFAIFMLMPLFSISDMLRWNGLETYPFTDIVILPWSSLAASFYGVLAAYAMLNDQVTRIRLLIGQRLAWVIRLLFFGAALLLQLVVLAVLRPGEFTLTGLGMAVGASLLAVVVCARFFPALLGHTVDKMERGLFADSLDYRDKLNSFIERLVLVDDVGKLLEESCQVLVDTVGFSFAAITIRHPGNPWRQHAYGTSGSLAWDGRQILDTLKTFEGGAVGRILRRDDLNPDSERERKLAELMATHALEAVFVVGLDAGKPLGFVAVRERRRWPLLDEDVGHLSRFTRQLAFQVTRLRIAETEQLRQANEAKDRFLSSINHEMRNPLNGIVGIVDMLLAGSLPPRETYLVSSLKACADRLNATIDEVLDFTNLDAGAVSLQEADMSLADLVESTCDSYNLTSNRVQVVALPAVSVWVRADAGKIRQILCNYIDNALKYGVPPEARLAVETTEADGGRLSVTFSVASTGPSLAEDELDSLFMPFVRGRRARDTQAPGLGIGLSLCRRVAGAMGGTVGATSRAGETVFHFNCAFMRADAVPPAEVVIPANAPLKILAVEDEAYNRLVLAHYLDAMGAETTWASDGESALKQIAARPFDVVLMDWFLPQLSGKELLLKMRAVAGPAIPPVIVISAYSTKAKQAECLEAGASAFVSKPISAKKLRDTLNSVLSNNRRQSLSVAAPVPPISTSPLTKADRDALRLSVAKDIHAILKNWGNGSAALAGLAHKARGKVVLLGSSDLVDQLEAVETHLFEKPTLQSERLKKTLHDSFQVWTTASAENEC